MGIACHDAVDRVAVLFERGDEMEEILVPLEALDPDGQEEEGFACEAGVLGIPARELIGRRPVTATVWLWLDDARNHTDDPLCLLSWWRSSG